MSIFCLADLHLSLSVDKPMDIFRGWDNYVEKLEENWKKIITDDDIVVIPGDISWALKLEETLADFKFIDSLPGKKFIIKGNHDLWWNSVTKMNNFLKENNIHSISFIYNSAEKIGDFAICGSRGWFFDDDSHSKKIITREAARLERSILAAKELDAEPLVFLHYPAVWNGQVCDEILDVLNRYEIKEVWHGHIHGCRENPQYSDDVNIKFHLTSCDYLKFMPILVKKF